MNKIGFRILIGFIFLWGTLIMFNLFSKPAAPLGVSDGKLAACPDSPNCVSTQASDERHKIASIAYEGTAQAAIARVKATLALMPRVDVVSEKENYLHATATTALMRFIDDVEFWFDDNEQVIHFRSASRVGYSDLGANRARMEAFRSLFQQEDK